MASWCFDPRRISKGDTGFKPPFPISTSGELHFRRRRALQSRGGPPLVPIHAKSGSHVLRVIVSLHQNDQTHSFTITPDAAASSIETGCLGDVIEYDPQIDGDSQRCDTFGEFGGSLRRARQGIRESCASFLPDSRCRTGRPLRWLTTNAHVPDHRGLPARASCALRSRRVSPPRDWL
jgi:hypothetical protein